LLTKPTPEKTRFDKGDWNSGSGQSLGLQIILLSIKMEGREGSTLRMYSRTKSLNTYKGPEEVHWNIFKITP